jgi:hypothetical protein
MICQAFSCTDPFSCTGLRGSRLEKRSGNARRGGYGAGAVTLRRRRVRPLAAALPPGGAPQGVGVGSRVRRHGHGRAAAAPLALESTASSERMEEAGAVASGMVRKLRGRIYVLQVEGYTARITLILFAEMPHRRNRYLVGVVERMLSSRVASWPTPRRIDSREAEQRRRLWLPYFTWGGSGADVAFRADRTAPGGAGWAGSA